MLNFGTFLLSLCIVLCYFDQVLNINAYDEDMYNARYYYKGEPPYKIRNIPEGLVKVKSLGSKYKYKGMQKNPTSYNAENVEMDDKKKSEPKTTTTTTTTKAPPKMPVMKQNETEAEKAERIHRTFEKLLTFVEIVGQVDNYVSTKWRNLVKTVSNMYEEEEEEYRLGVKKFKGCPTFLNET